VRADEKLTAFVELEAAIVSHNPSVGSMNKKQKILTAIALVVFAGIIVGHYSYPNGRYGFYPSDYGWYYLDLSKSANYGLIPDVRLPIFTLAVFYAGLFFILGPTATKNCPPAPTMKARHGKNE